jgi:hypothetical protein
MKSMLFMGIVFLLLLSSCATQDTALGNSETVFRALDEKAIRRIAFKPQENPYSAPSVLLYGRPYEFIVLEAVFPIGAKRIDLSDISCLDANGSQCARFYTASELVEFWRQWANEESCWEAMKREIRKSYFPEGIAKSEKRYILLLVGKRPIQKPVTVQADFVVDGELRSLELVIE